MRTFVKLIFVSSLLFCAVQSQGKMNGKVDSLVVQKDFVDGMYHFNLVVLFGEFGGERPSSAVLSDLGNYRIADKNKKEDTVQAARITMNFAGNPVLESVPFREGADYTLYLTGAFKPLEFKGKVIYAGPPRTNISNNGTINLPKDSGFVYESSPTGNFDFKVIDVTKSLFGLDLSVANHFFIPTFNYTLKGFISTDANYTQNALSLQVDRAVAWFDITEEYAIKTQLSLKWQTTQKFVQHDVSVAAGLSTRVPLLSSIVSIINFSSVPIRDPRLYLGYEYAFVRSGQRADSIGINRPRAELAWRFPVLNGRLYVSVAGELWYDLAPPDGGPKKQRGNIDAKIEYMIDSQTSGFFKYLEGTLAPNFINDKSISTGLSITIDGGTAAVKQK